MWIHRWRFKVSDSKNDLSQIEHENGFSPVWICMCNFKLQICKNDLSQIEHKSDFFSSVIPRAAFHMTDLLQISKRFITNGAFKGFLSSVNPKVTF